MSTTQQCSSYAARTCVIASKRNPLKCFGTPRQTRSSCHALNTPPPSSDLVVCPLRPTKKFTSFRRPRSSAAVTAPLRELLPSALVMLVIVVSYVQLRVMLFCCSQLLVSKLCSLCFGASLSCDYVSFFLFFTLRRMGKHTH